MVPIKNFLDKFPGGIVTIPLLIGCCLNTFCPSVLQIGGFTTGIAQGTSCLMGILFLCLGAQLNLKCAKQALKTGFSLVIVKFAVAVIIGLAVAKFMNDSLFGLSSLAIIAGVSNSNGAMYATLTGKYGTESDQAATAIISINDGPFLTMLALGAAGVASIPFKSLIAALAPLIVGVILGNLDPKMKDCLTRGMETVILGVAFAVGCTMDFKQVIVGGPSGILLGLVALVIGGFFNILTDKLTGGSGVAGASISSIAANAVATPAAIAEIDKSFKYTAGVAAAQLASAVIVTALLTPFLTSWIYERNKKKKQDAA